MSYLRVLYSADEIKNFIRKNNMYAYYKSKNDLPCVYNKKTGRYSYLYTPKINDINAYYHRNDDLPAAVDKNKYVMKFLKYKCIYRYNSYAIFSSIGKYNYNKYAKFIKGICLEYLLENLNK